MASAFPSQSDILFLWTSLWLVPLPPACPYSQTILVVNSLPAPSFLPSFSEQHSCYLVPTCSTFLLYHIRPPPIANTSFRRVGGLSICLVLYPQDLTRRRSVNNTESVKARMDITTCVTDTVGGIPHHQGPESRSLAPAAFKHERRILYMKPPGRKKKNKSRCREKKGKHNLRNGQEIGNTRGMDLRVCFKEGNYF